MISRATKRRLGRVAVPNADQREKPRFARLEISLLVLLLAVSFTVRWPFRSVSLIRDEGEYVHLGQEILRGRLPYVDVYNQKTPVTFYLMAGVQKLAGTNLAAVRVFTAFYGLLATFVLYLLARRLFGYSAALWAALAFCVMTFDQCGTDHPSSTEFFMLLWILLALYLWYLGLDGRRKWILLLAGVAAGLAYQTKQTGMMVLAFFLAERLLDWLRQWRTAPRAIWPNLRDWALAAAGFALVLLVILGYFASQGAGQAYVECTWTNNWQYVNQRQRFFADPIRYAPANMGNDVVLAVEQSQSVAGRREHGGFHGGRLYLFANEETQQRFMKHPNYYAERALQRLGRTAQRTIVRGGTDGSRLTELGLPTPNLATGEHAIHSPLEWTSLEEMEQAVAWLLSICQEWTVRE